MRESTYLLGSQEESRRDSPRSRNFPIDENEGGEEQHRWLPILPCSTSFVATLGGCLVILLLGLTLRGIPLGHGSSWGSSSPRTSRFPNQQKAREEVAPEQNPVFFLAIEQKLDLVDYWKQFLSRRKVWNQTKVEWNRFNDKASNVTGGVDLETVKNHTYVWANMSQEQGQKWWENAKNYFQNISDQMDQYQQERDDHDNLQSRLYESSKKKPGRHNLKPENIYMNHSRAYEFLLSHGSYGAFQYSQDYFLLNQGLEAQKNQAYCAVATVAAVLNSLRGLMELPLDPIYNPYPYATQSILFNDCTDTKVIMHNDSFDGILSSPFGLNLESTKSLLACHLSPDEGWNIKLHHLNTSITTVDELRNKVRKALLNPFARVLINYDRKMAGQIGGGHFSPIGSYSPSLDAFLVLDVAKYKYPPVWIPTETLYRSLGTIDSCGIWDGPAAQVELPSELLHPNSVQDLSEAMEALHCQEAHRGFIVVERVRNE